MNVNKPNVVQLRTYGDREILERSFGDVTLTAKAGTAIFVARNPRPLDPT